MVSIVRSKPLTVIVVTAAALLLLVALLVAALYRFQERIAFQPQGPPYPDVDSALRVAYSARDGQPLFAYLLGDSSSEQGLLLAFHGNADMAARQIGWAEEVVRRSGMAVMLAEYRGYAGLPGKPTYAGSQLDTDAAYDFARETLQVPQDRIAYFGHSLGTAIAAELAARRPPFALLLQSPFTSAQDMARFLIGPKPASFTWNHISRIHFNTVDRVKLLDVPVSVTHGAKDGLIPPEMGRQVYEAARNRGKWLIVAEASHNDVATKGGNLYWQWLTDSLVLPRIQ